MDEIVYAGLIVALALFIVWFANISESEDEHTSSNIDTPKRPKPNLNMEERIRQRKNAKY